MLDREEISFQSLIDALLDESTPFHPRFLYRLSDLEPAELAQLQATWPQLPAWRRQALLEDLETLGSVDNLLSFESIGRYAVLDEDARIRQLGVQILWEFETPDLIQVFLNLLKSDQDAKVRAAAAIALGRFVYLGELEEISAEKLQRIENNLLSTIREDEEPIVRRRALESIGFSSREEVTGLIRAAFESGETEWVASSLLAMGCSADERWNATVLTMLDSKTPLLRSEAARAAGELEISEAAPRLFELIDDSDADVRAASIWSLSQIGGEGVRETLERMLEDADEDEEADLIENALDNLAFTEGLPAFSLFDFPESDLESEVDELLDDQDEYLDFEDEDEDEFSDIDADEEEDEDYLD